MCGVLELHADVRDCSPMTEYLPNVTLQETNVTSQKTNVTSQYSTGTSRYTIS